MSFPVIATVFEQLPEPEIITRDLSVNRGRDLGQNIRLEQLNIPLTEYNSYSSIEIEPGYILECYDQEQLVHTFPSGMCNLLDYTFTHLVIRVDVNMSNPIIAEIYPQINFKGNVVQIFLNQLNEAYTNTHLNIVSEEISVVVKEEFKIYFQLTSEHPVEILETGAYNSILIPNGFVLFKLVPDTPVSLMAAPVEQVRARLILTPEEILQFQQEPEESVISSLEEMDQGLENGI
jgi:hypothetical protein